MNSLYPLPWVHKLTWVASKRLRNDTLEQIVLIWYTDVMLHGSRLCRCTFRFLKGGGGYPANIPSAPFFGLRYIVCAIAERFLYLNSITPCPLHRLDPDYNILWKYFPELKDNSFFKSRTWFRLILFKQNSVLIIVDLGSDMLDS